MKEGNGNTVRSLLRSMRLRTLPLSLGGVLCGGLLAAPSSGREVAVLLLTALTACTLQVLSNLSNELGDYRSGVDDASLREGPAYSMLGGELSEAQMVSAIRCTAAVACIVGLAMVWLSFGTILALQPLLLLLLGAAAIWAATHYTLGKNPYGYRGLGDVFVFIFFGLVSVWGSFFVSSHELGAPLKVVLAAVGVGMLSVGVLNVNNIRDMETDRGHRRTTALTLGEVRAKCYQTVLVVGGVACLLVGGRCFPWGLLTVPFFVWHLVLLWSRRGRGLDPALPLLVLSTCVLSLLYGALNMNI